MRAPTSDSRAAANRRCRAPTRRCRPRCCRIRLSFRLRSSGAFNPSAPRVFRPSGLGESLGPLTLRRTGPPCGLDVDEAAVALRAESLARVLVVAEERHQVAVELAALDEHRELEIAELEERALREDALRNGRRRERRVER